VALTVLSIAFPFAPVGPQAVGGAEQVLTHLDRALTDAGHRSVVVACEGSRPSGQLIPVSLPDDVVLEEPVLSSIRRNCQESIDRALRAFSVDLIHMHGLDFYRYSLPREIPTLVTLHMPISWYDPGVLKTFGKRAQFCCVSNAQKSTCPPYLSETPVIENGVEVSTASEHSEKSDFAVVMGRICEEKNQHAALEAGSRAGTRVLVSGQVFPYPEHKRYFDEKVTPLLCPTSNGVTHEFIGPVFSTQKIRILASAKCLLHPTLAPETSSLIAMEAIAAGTPVIAYPAGALRDIISDGKTGFLVRNVAEMADAILRVDSISRDRCRDEAVRRFSRDEMARRYFRIYQTLLNKDSQLNPLMQSALS
jgi:glycosyltransferase involved in cell wall biosynthesis